MPYYLKIDGIEGQVTSKDHEGWIELQSLDLGVGCKVSTPVGRRQEHRGYIPSFTNVTLTKPMDKSSPLLFQAACRGKPQGTALIHACRGGNEIEPYLEYNLENCVICHYKTAGLAGLDSETDMLEEMELNFTKITMRFIERNADNSNATPINAGYNLESAEIV